MVIIPKEKPVIENLNSYYLDVRKLCEHYQGEIGSGGIHFKSPNSEGIIFFDKDEILNAYFKDKSEEFTGKDQAERIMNILGGRNFTVNIYKIDNEKVYFWARVPKAVKIYKDLSTEFTDLKGLIKKMASEKLTGYIEVSIADGEESGIIFLNSGVILGGSYSWRTGGPNRTKESQELLIKKTKKSGGVFHVSSIPAPEARRAKPSQPPPETAAPGPSPEPSSPERSPGPAPAETAQARKATDGTSAAGKAGAGKAGAGKAGARKATDGTPAAGKAGAGKVGAGKAGAGKVGAGKVGPGKVGPGKVGAGAPNPSASAPMDLPRVLTALEEFVAIFESVVQTRKRLKGKFSPLLKKKFVDKADRYPFLDPFAAEFEYVNRKISFVGDAGEKELADGVFESVKELAEDLGLQAPFQETLAPWIKKHSRDFSGIGVTV